MKGNIIDLSALFVLKQRENSSFRNNSVFIHKLARDFCLLCKGNEIARARELYRMYVTDEIEEEFKELIKEEEEIIEREIEDDE